MRCSVLNVVVFLLFAFLVASDLVCIDDVCENDTEVPESGTFLGSLFDYEVSMQRMQKESHVDKDQYGAFVEPMPLKNCEFVDMNEELLEQFFPIMFEEPIENNEQLLSYLCGTENPAGSMPFAQR